ncbi:hypothetical protein RS83_00453 [Microbacterium oxydans]|uniref:DUF559 domain-containing protein n=2 Tax=Microbacterium oxydans TaxID=82380 RepID=A0A0F0LEM5_9MICO|nr:hypothetical protein RS83_00453 [Microbacterium oxydans]
MPVHGPRPPVPALHTRTMSRHPRRLPADLGAVFTPEQARAAGLTARRLRAKDLERPYRGVLVVTPNEHQLDDRRGDREPLARDRAQRQDVCRRVRLYRPLMVDHAFFAGRTAAGIWGLPVDCSGDLEVGVPAPHRAPRRQGIVGRQMSPGLVTVREVEGLPVSSPASTWAMMAATLSVRELVILGDAVVRVPRDNQARRRPERALATVGQLLAATAAGPRRCVGRLRDAVGRIRTESASPLETEYRLDAEDAGVPDAELDVEIRDARGRLLGVTEFEYPEYGVLVEIEGDHHRTSRQQWHRDIEKYAAYVALGFEVVRLTSAHIRGERPTATAIVRDALIRRGWRP